MWGEIASALGPVLDTGLQAAFNARSANKQMDFQREMSGTAYQRAAADMEKAGLNRILALGNPASSPGGASASISDPNISGKSVQIATARSAINLQNEQAQLLRKQQELTEEQAEKTRREAANLPYAGQQMISQTETNQALTGQYRAVIERIVEGELPKLLAEVRVARSNASKAELRQEFTDKAKPYVNAVMELLPTPTAKDAKYWRDNTTTLIGDVFDRLFDREYKNVPIRPNRPSGPSSRGKW